MRRFVFEEHRLIDITSYPAEARLFSRVDQPVVTATFKAGTSSHGIRSKLKIFKADRECHSVVDLIRTAEELAKDDYALPIGFAAGFVELHKKFRGLSTLYELEGDNGRSLWAGREIDETRISEKTERGSRYPFIKGRMISRHSIKQLPNKSVRREFAERKKSIGYERIVWRDVSRSSQARRMICAIIPPTWVAGNSLHVAHFKDGNPLRLRALYAVLSSYVFEIQVRSRLGTGHMSLGAVRSTALPELHEKSLQRLASVAQRTIGGAPNEHLEIAVAKSYGLNRDDMAEILSHFPKTGTLERDAILAKRAWV